MAGFLEKIFSIKNEDKRKVVSLLGVKIKFKSNSLAAKIAINNLVENVILLNKENAKLKKQIAETNKKYEKEITKINTDLNFERDNIKIIKNDLSGVKLCYKTKECIMCGAPELNIIGKNPDFENTHVVQCKKCGFMFNFYNKKIEDYYKEDYRNQRREHISENYIKLMNTRAVAQYDFIKNNIDIDLKNLKIMEIGCSLGLLLNKFDESNDFTAYEPDIEMANGAQINNPKAVVKKEECNLDNLDSDKYDLILLSHVFEHFNDPIKSMENLIRTTKNNGYIFIEIPNETVETVQYMCENKKGVGHYSYFNPDLFKMLISKFENAQILKIETYSMTLDDFLSKVRSKKSIAASWDMAKPIENNKGIHIRCLIKVRKENND